MIFSYRNGEPITEDEMLIVTDEEKEDIKEIKINDSCVSINCLPRFDNYDNEIYYLQQGMYLYLISGGKGGSLNYIVYVIEQGVEHNKMKIKNIDSYVVVSNDEPLLRYCVPSQVDEKKNIVIGVKEILNQLEFMQDKEKQYLVNKIEEFFEGKKTEPLIIREQGLPISERRVVGRAGHTIEYNGKIFNSISAFQREYGINGSTYDKAIKSGMSLNEIVERYSRKGKPTKSKASVKMPFTYRGETFKTLSSLRAKYQISAATMTRALNKGMPMEEIIEKYSNARTRPRYTSSLIKLPFEYKGETFMSLKSFARRYMMNPSSVERGFEMGLSLDEIVERYKNGAGTYGGNKQFMETPVEKK